MQVSVLGFGGAEIGGLGNEPETVSRLLNEAIDQGLNVIDTAECYGDSEALIGKAVAGRRDEFHLFTKCGHSSGFEEPDWDLKMLAKSIDRSLERLQTDYIDLIQLHSCDEALLRQGDVIDVLLRAKEAGKARYIGYSGDNEEALYAVESGAFDSLQTSINVADQRCVDLYLKEAESRGLAVIAKRPVANVAWASEPAPDAYARPYWERLQALDYDFLTWALPDAVGFALRWTLAQPAVGTAIVGTSRPGRWAANAKALNAGPLSSAEVEAIRARWQEVGPAEWIGKR